MLSQSCTEPGIYVPHQNFAFFWCSLSGVPWQSAFDNKPNLPCILWVEGKWSPSQGTINSIPQWNITRESLWNLHKHYFQVQGIVWENITLVKQDTNISSSLLPCDVTWTYWQLRSPATSLFKSLFGLIIKIYIKTPHSRLVVRRIQDEMTGGTPSRARNIKGVPWHDVRMIPWVIYISRFEGINMLRLRRNRHHFIDDVFKCLFLMKMYWFSFKFHLDIFPRVQ